MTYRSALKSATGRGMSSVNRRCDFTNTLFILGHMRSGSTALSNVICSRSDFSGYGESHISYCDENSLGQLVVNQARRRKWTPRAPSLFDKVLHNRYDASVPASFYRSRAVFLVRQPAETLSSIRLLFTKLNASEYQNDAEVACYYTERVNQLLVHWKEFPEGNKVAVTHRRLTSDPDAVLTEISQRLRIDPPLCNEYASSAASQTRGAGDPLQSGSHSAISAGVSSIGPTALSDLQLTKQDREAVKDSYERFLATTGADTAQANSDPR